MAPSPGATVAVRERVGVYGQQVPLEVLDEREVRVGAPKLHQLRRLAADENVISLQITLIHTEKPEGEREARAPKK